MNNQATAKANRQPSEVRMTFNGAWQPAPRRDWQGVLQGTEDVVGLSFLCVEGQTQWVKSDRGHADGLEARIMLGNYDSLGLDVQVNFSIGNNGPRWRTLVKSAAYLPELLVPPNFRTGMLLDFAKVDGNPSVVLKALFLARRDVRVGRNSLWHLRDELVEFFPESLRRVLTYGRTGEFAGSI